MVINRNYQIQKKLNKNYKKKQMLNHQKLMNLENLDCKKKKLIKELRAEQKKELMLYGKK